MPLTILISSLALLIYAFSIFMVGRGRAKYKIMPPATQGEEGFNRIFRVQQNTLEQLMLFLPSLWMFSHLVSELWGGVIGAFWLVGRCLYMHGYYREVGKRLPGFIVAFLASAILLAGCLIASAMAMVPFIRANF